MGQITRCPSCGTMFKVVPDQLKISDGWVRCGHCAEVFDAQLNMHSPAGLAPPVPMAPAPTPDPVPAGPSALTKLELNVAAVSENRAVGAGIDLSLSPEAVPPSALISDAAVQNSAAAPAWMAVPEPAVDVAGLSAVQQAVQEPHSDQAGQEPREPEALVSTVPPATHGSPPPRAETSLEVSFMREARRRAFWRRPVVRLGLATLGLVLTATLLAQIVLDRRDQLAAYRPDLRPALEALCQLAACSIQPWRQIDALIIDGSSFNSLSPNVYRLALTVKNVAALDVAKPSIELTLTDVRELTVLRRVLTPAELGAAATTIKAGGEWAATATVQLAASVTGVAGYRVLAFYP